MAEYSQETVNRKLETINSLTSDIKYYEQLTDELKEKVEQLQKDVAFWKDLAESCECNN